MKISRAWMPPIKMFNDRQKLHDMSVHMFSSKTCKLSTNIIERQGTKNSTVDAPVKFEISGKRGVITLNRPSAFNALSVDMVSRIRETLTDWREKLEMVIIRSSNSAFCSGADLLALWNKGMDEGDNYGREVYRLEYMIATLKIPFVAIVGGVCLGSGMGISVHGRVQIVTENTTMAMPETRIGFHPDAGASFFFSKLAGGLGMYLGLTGHRLRGKDAVKAGLASHFVHSSQLNALESALINGSIPAENISQRISEMYPVNIENPYVFPERVHDIIDRAFTQPCLEDMITELERDGSEWSIATLQTLKKMSPTSLKITVRTIHEGKNKSLKECFLTDNKISSAIIHSVISNDFYEGIEELLVNKDHNPKWNPPDINEVSDNEIDKIFKMKLPEHLVISFDD